MMGSNLSVNDKKHLEVSAKLNETELVEIDDGMNKKEMDNLKDENEKLKEQLKAMQDKLNALEVNKDNNDKPSFED